MHIKTSYFYTLCLIYFIYIYIHSYVIGIINGKGGGRPGKLQGTATKLNAMEDVQQLLLHHTYNC